MGVIPLFLTLSEQLRPIHLEQVNLFSHIVDFGVNHDESLLEFRLTFDVNLDKQLPSLLFLGKLNRVGSGRVLLATNFNRCVNVENGLFILSLDCQKVLNLCLFVLLDVTVKQ